MTTSSAKLERAQLEQTLKHIIDHKTKPLGALGQLESLALQVGLIQNTTTPQVKMTSAILFAADHGVVAAGVSAFPSDVTWQMVLNFANGGAAASVFAATFGVTLDVVDVGVAHDFSPMPNLTISKVAYGSANMVETAALSTEQYHAAIEVGRERAISHIMSGANVLILGEMGIGNTTAAAALMAALTDLPVSECIGRGTGVDDAGLARKQAAIEAALARVQATYQRPLSAAEALQELGGLEIAAMVGAMNEAVEQGVAVLIDGFIASSAALVACGMNADIKQGLIFAHGSAEHGHAKMLQTLQVKPLLDLGLRLGEGSGALLALPLLRAAVAFLNNMASFDSAGVSQSNSA